MLLHTVVCNNYLRLVNHYFSLTIDRSAAMLANQFGRIADMPITTVFSLNGVLWRKVTKRTLEKVPVNGERTWAKRYYFSKDEYGSPIVPTTTKPNKYR